MAETVSLRIPVKASFVICRDPGQGSIHIQRITNGGISRLGAHTVYSIQEFAEWKRMLRVRYGVHVPDPVSTEMVCGCEVARGYTRFPGGVVIRAWNTNSEGRIRGMILRCQSRTQSDQGESSIPVQREASE